MKSLTFDYDPAYEPPAPVIEIEINGYRCGQRLRDCSCPSMHYETGLTFKELGGYK